ncbi:hypothetical protein [Paractinoplanes durhamensis]|uniref:DUF4129 domain-containing protein n=1 Tax=Paractinoplanes durhamensis TaxID=113563 RepID=A0ABQ3Z2L5_9ACTN|nr:hypothetical protein [Actinoplanes durhamensis]GIE04070.1 hypothetical protein Adu01nite_54200 [Actinoplanes durhamensis]
MSDGGLEGLFSYRDEPVEEVAEPVAREKSRAWWVVRNALLIAGATVVTIAALRAGGQHISVVLVVAFFIGLRAVLFAVSEVAPPALPKRRGRSSRVDDGRALDSLRIAVRRWERSLDRAHTDPDLYTSNVLPVLAELTDERLRLRHGITRASDPRRARELLGDPLWAALHDHGRRTAKSRELETYVDALERL